MGKPFFEASLDTVDTRHLYENGNGVLPALSTIDKTHSPFLRGQVFACAAPRLESRTGFFCWNWTAMTIE
ncbi:MAG: hypothetical protein Q7J76_03690 [Candidatus Brocadiaceae bacterium]|uniref:hypothetical protein n=1 Tax=Candidatus Wunengus sp. YC61 TaxID=3367698 RepID=UPI002719741D|nr:hypothetical protein [Candidatus Brocadiaceae bacterium]